MKETRIEEAIKYLQSLDQQNTEINHFDITYGTTTARRTLGVMDIFETVPDGSFCISIRGKVMKDQ